MKNFINRALVAKKHLKLFFALFAMLALGVGNAWAEEYALYSGTITEGDYIIVSDGNAMNNTVTSSRFGNTAVTGTSDKISDPDATIIWHIAPSGDYWTIYNANANKYAAGTGAKNKAQLLDSGTDNKSLWTVTGSSTYEFVNKANAAANVNKNLRRNGDYGFACYATGTGKALSLYKKVEQSGGGETPDPEPEPDPEPDPDPTPGTSGEETWTLVTNGSDLKAGDIIVIASNTKGFVASRTITSNYMGEVSTTFSADKTTITTLPAEAAQLTIGGTSGAWTLTYDGKQLGATAVKKVAWDSGTKSWSITISNDGGATIQNGTSTYGRFLHNVSSTRFTTYTSDVSTSMLLPQIYKKVTSSGGGEPSTPTPSVRLEPSPQDFGTINVGETLSQEFIIKTENTTAALTASISDEINYAISGIENNKITVTYKPQSAATHSAVLTVKAGEEATATVNLTGKAVQALEGTWILVTDASSLNVGDKIIIAAKESEVALSTTQASNNRPEVAITKNDNTITATSETQVLTLQAGNKENTLALYTGDGYLYAASSGSNWLRTETTLSDNSSWSIAVAADGTATLIAQGDNTRNTLYYNKNNNIFSCYSNAQQPIALYKNTNGKQLAGLAYATTKYLTKLGDAFTTPTLTNPNSLTVTYSSSDNNVATVDNTGTVTIKAAGVVVITAAFAGDASYLEGSAKYTLCVTEHAGTQADPYSVADARRVIDVMETAEGVYATGVVSKIVTAYNSTNGNITYNISVDGTTAADQLQAYNGKSYNGANFTSADDIKVGDEVVVKGNLKKYNTTYEFDEENQLVSLNRTKEQAGLAYAETEQTANVGEDFVEPTLTNPNSLSITYSSNNTSLATVDATTGEVSILAAGKVTITASSAADATYAAGSASYNITISDPSLAIATLPFYFDGKKDDIEGTAGMTQEGIDSDYAAKPHLKFNTAGDWAIVQFDSEPGEFSFLLKQNGSNAGTFTVYESANGEDYTSIWSGGDLGGNGESATVEPTLSATARYVKFEYTTKGASTNYGLGKISIKKADHRQEAGLVWSTENVSITLGDAFTAPTLSNPNGLSGITFASSNEELATVNNAGAITLVSGKTGTATITATFADGHADYKPAEATCVITVSPKSEKVVILAQLEGQWYAMTGAYVSGKTNVLSAILVEYINGTLYNVAEADKASIEWQRSMNGNKAIFKNGDNYLTGGTDTDLTLKTTEFEWDYNGGNYLCNDGKRTFLYCENTKTNVFGFKNYAISNAGSVKSNSDGTTESYSSTPVVTTPIYKTATFYTRTVTPGNYGTICLPYAVNNYTGATFYKVAGKEDNKIVFDEVTELEAGKPYIFMAEATEIKLAQVGEEYTGSAQLYNSLQGTFSQIDPAEDNILVGNYMVVNNIIKKCGINCGLKANRAYFVATELENNLGAAPQPMPGRRRVTMGVTGENEATGVDNITENGVIAPKKLIENGQLIIIRDGVKFNVQGQKL